MLCRWPYGSEGFGGKEELRVVHAIPKKDFTLILLQSECFDQLSWDKVMTDLRRRGHQVVAARIPLTSFADDVETLRQLLHRQTGKVVLAAHSYPGAVMTAAAAGNEKVKGLVYVSASVPEGGASVRRISLPFKDGVLRLAAEEVDWISAEDNYVRVYRGKQDLLVRTTLSKLEEQFQSEVLLRVHRSYMVNINRVREGRRGHNDHYEIVLGDGKTVKCSRRYKRRLRVALHL